MWYTEKLIYIFVIKILAHIINWLVCNSLENGKENQAVIFYLK